MTKHPDITTVSIIGIALSLTDIIEALYKENCELVGSLKEAIAMEESIIRVLEIGMSLDDMDFKSIDELNQILEKHKKSLEKVEGVE